MAEKKLDIILSAKGADQVDGALSRIGKGIKGLKDSSSGKGLMELTTLLKGGGIAMGVNFAAQAVKGLADVTREYASNSISGTEALMRAAEAVPILGNVASAIKAIKLAWDELNVDNVRKTQAQKEREQYARMLAKFQSDKDAAREDVKRINRQLDLELMSPEERSAFLAEEQFRKRHQEIVNRYATINGGGVLSGKLREERDSAIAKNRAARDKAVNAQSAADAQRLAQAELAEVDRIRERTDAIRGEIDALRTRNEQMFMSDSEIKVMDFERRGADADEVRLYQHLLDQNEALEGQKRLEEELAAIRRESIEKGMTEAEVRLARLKELGATPDQITEASRLLGQGDKANNPLAGLRAMAAPMLASRYLTGASVVDPVLLEQREARKAAQENARTSKQLLESLKVVERFVGQMNLVPMN